MFQNATGISNYVQTFDFRSMRKIEDQQAIVVSIENASAAEGAQYVMKFRMLFKLH